MPRFTLATRLSLDALMAVLFISGLAFRSTGRLAHEWLGMGFVVLFLLHLAINFGWCRTLFTGRYSLGRTLNTLTNAALLVAMIVLCFTGVMNSRHVFGFSQFFDGAYLRQLHSAAAYWGLVIIGVHTGMHWEMISGALRRLAKRGKQSCAAGVVLRLTALLVVACGVWASFDRAMASKLFLGFAFDFWDPSRPLVFFYAANLAIAGTYALGTHYALKIIRIRKKGKN